MNLFGLSKKNLPSDSTILYEQKLVQYRNTLEQYKQCLVEYSGKLEGLEKKHLEDQLSMVQTALDLTYLKEQQDRTRELIGEMKKWPIGKIATDLEGLTATLVETNFKFEGIDKNVVGRLSELQMELQRQTLYHTKQLQLELLDGLKQITKAVKNGNILLWFLMIFSLIGLSGLAFLILYVLEIIPF
jgi:hypothetical protein